MAGHVARIGGDGNAHNIWSKNEGKIPRGRSRSRWEDIIKFYLKLIWLGRCELAVRYRERSIEP